MNTALRLHIALALTILSCGVQAQTLQSWMSPEVQDAWGLGFKGQKVTIQVIDEFKSGTRFSGNLGSGTLYQRHGEWTRMEAGMIAPLATITSVDYNSARAISLARGLNVLNLSYGMFAANGYSNSQISWSSQEKSIIAAGRNGTAVIAKAAGNDGVAVNAANASGQADYLNRALIGGPSAMFVGALEKNGTSAAPAALASYSNRAGVDQTVQNQFLVVGVEGSKTGLYGTSFAAPIVTGYAAILGSKFPSATPTTITNQLLNTARTGTISNYDRAVHGRGEASISNALSAVSVR
ncbi:MAG: hypothetical protein RIS88_522 [Pseudomonadota bacterium]